VIESVRFECSAAEVDLLGELVGVDVRRFPLTIPYAGTSIAERAELTGQLIRRLDDEGLVVHGGAPAAPVRRAIGVLGSPWLAVTMLGRCGETDHYTLAGAVGRDAVVVVQRGDRIAFTLVDPASLPGALLGRLPYLPPGPGLPVTISMPAVAAGSGPIEGTDEYSADDPLWGITALGRPRPGERHTPRAEVSRILARPRRGTGLFTVVRRTRHGSTLAEVGSVGWFDNDEGRYAVLTSTDQGGLRHITYTPGHYARFHQALQSLIDHR
jgi:hypothetical protein